MLSLDQALHHLAKDRVIAYPTEAVYGLGCACTPQAIARLQQLKPRPTGQAWILVIPSWESIAHWVAPLPDDILLKRTQYWPGPTTLIVPASEQAPHFLCHQDQTLALRHSSHPDVQALVHAWGAPLISTSANPPQQKPARSHDAVHHYFPSIAGTLCGSLGTLAQPTEMIHLMTGEKIR